MYNTSENIQGNGHSGQQYNVGRGSGSSCRAATTKAGFLGVVFVGILTSLAAAPQTASAMEKPTVLSRKVSYHDLDLRREADAKILISRINRAARYVCSGSDWRSEFMYSTAYRAGVRDSTSRAVAGLDSPVVTALFNQSAKIKLASKN